jgi:hypothetical protein
MVKGIMKENKQASRAAAGEVDQAAAATAANALCAEDRRRHSVNFWCLGACIGATQRSES